MRNGFAMIVTTVLLFTASCQGDGAGPGVDQAAKAVLCPAQPEPAVPGCFAQESSQICSPDGCNDLCDASETPVTCSKTELSGPIPEPDAAAGCRILRLPTPATSLFYCCKCGG